MKVLNLRCLNHHAFEGWFASEDDYQGQVGRGLLECPMCADKTIVRMPTAPRLNMMPKGRSASGGSESSSSAAEPQQPQPASPSVPSPFPAGVQIPQAVALQSIWMHAVQHVLAHTDDVGDRFAEEARRMHYGEAKERPIRGQATPEDTDALREEGIEVMALRMPVVAKGSLQ